MPAEPSPEILVIHSDVYAFGGAENYCIRALEVLHGLGVRTVVLHAGGAFDAERIFAWSGIRLDPRMVRFLTAPPFVRWPKMLHGLVLLRYAFVLRAARRLVAGFPLVLGTFGEVPIEVPRLIQSGHIPLFFHDAESLSYLGVDLPPGSVRHFVRALYVRLARRVAGWSRPAVEAGELLANSAWTARQFRRHYPGLRASVMYQGAATSRRATDPDVPRFADRKNNFVILGRVVPFKRVDAGIRIIDALRMLGWDIGLLIVGNGEGGYAERISAMVAERSHVAWHRNLSRAKIENLVVDQKWGLHCAQHEHYGLAALELAALGCIVFVPDSGGQVEVIADERLRYSDEESAVQKIAAALASSVGQEELRSTLIRAVDAHTVENFKRNFATAITRVLHPDTIQA